jgi:PAS domain-containing protein
MKDHVCSCILSSTLCALIFACLCTCTCMYRIIREHTATHSTGMCTQGSIRSTKAADMRAEKIARERREREERERPQSKVSSKPPSSGRRQSSRDSPSQETDTHVITAAVFEAVRGVMGGMVEDVTQRVLAEKHAHAEVAAVVASLVDNVVAVCEETRAVPPVIPPYPSLHADGDVYEANPWLMYIVDLHDFINRTGAVVIGFDIEGIINEWNAPAVAVFGRTYEEMVGMPLMDLDLFEPEDKAAIFQIFDQCRMGNEIPALRINIPIRGEDMQAAVQAIQHGEITAHDTNFVEENAIPPAAHDYNVAEEAADKTLQNTAASPENNGANQEDTEVAQQNAAGDGGHNDDAVATAVDGNKNPDPRAETQTSDSNMVDFPDQVTAAGTDEQGEQDSRSHKDKQDVIQQTLPVSHAVSGHEEGSGRGSASATRDGGSDECNGKPGASSVREGGSDHGKRLTAVLYAVTRNDEKGTVTGVIGAIGTMSSPDSPAEAGPLIDIDPLIPSPRVIMTSQEYLAVATTRSHMTKPSTARSGSAKSAGPGDNEGSAKSVGAEDNEGRDGQEGASDIETMDDRDNDDAKIESLEPVQESPAEEEDVEVPEFAAKPSTPPQPVDSESFGAVSRPHDESSHEHDNMFARSLSAPLRQDAHTPSDNYERSHSVPIHSSTREGFEEQGTGTFLQDYHSGAPEQGEGSEPAKPGEDENASGLDEQSIDGRSDVHTATASSRSAFMPSRRETSRLGTAASMVLRLASAGRAASARLATGSDMTPTPMEMSQIESAPSTAQSVAPPRTPAEVCCLSACLPVCSSDCMPAYMCIYLCVHRH